MKAILSITFILILTTSCKENSGNNNSDYESDGEEEIQMEDVVDNDDAERYYNQTGEYPDGTYCSEVEYYNPSTGTRKTYNLDADVENSELIVIHWPNGGWLDDTHFHPEDITDGECEFTSDRGYRYTVTLKEFGGCAYTEEYKIRRQVNDEVEQTTCSKCGGEKDDYEEYCSNCKDELESESDQ